jgi:DNA-binding beta-propeller fold protein YncE
MRVTNRKISVLAWVAVALLAARWPALAGVALDSASTPAHKENRYHLASTLAIGGEGGWDYLAVDEGARRLYVSHSIRVEVLDADTGKPVGAIDGLSGVHGIAVAPALGRGFISNGKTASVIVFELATSKKTAEIPVQGENPDAILFDPVTKRVFAFNHSSGNVAVIDAAAGNVVGSIDVGGTLEFATTDLAGTIYVNVEDKSQVAAIDAKTMAVKARWPLAPCEEPTGQAIDRDAHRLFVVCGNKMAAVVDSTNGKVVTTIPTGDRTDGAGFDPGTKTAFSSNGEGTLTVVHEDSPDKFHVVENVTTRKGARTMTVDEKTHRVFLSTADYGPTPAATADQPRPRPSIVPGTFVVLVVEP